MRSLALTLLIALSSCSADAPSEDVNNVSDMRADSPVVDDMSGGADAENDDSSIADVGFDIGKDTRDDMRSLPVEATNYCELTVDMFCAYYLRCGRIAATDEADCHTTFMETCENVYEPFYKGYEDAGLLVLSESGVLACRDHLAEVACEQQIFDLDLGCSQMWVGQSGDSAPCAPGIGSFVCNADTTCRIGVNLCGTCKTFRAIGETCDADNRCGQDAECINATCVARGLPGNSCAGEITCVVGSFCQDDVCQARNYVAVGQACNATDRCPYKSTCSGGVCVEDALIGEDCTNRGCASGYCDGAVCQALRAPFAGCSEDQQCLSRDCNGQFCGPTVSKCIIEP